MMKTCSLQKQFSIHGDWKIIPHKSDSWNTQTCKSSSPFTEIESSRWWSATWSPKTSLAKAVLHSRRLKVFWWMFSIFRKVFNLQKQFSIHGDWKSNNYTLTFQVHHTCKSSSPFTEIESIVLQANVTETYYYLQKQFSIHGDWKYSVRYWILAELYCLAKAVLHSRRLKAQSWRSRDKSTSNLQKKFLTHEDWKWFFFLKTNFNHFLAKAVPHSRGLKADFHLNLARF